MRFLVILALAACGGADLEPLTPCAAATGATPGDTCQPECMSPNIRDGIQCNAHYTIPQATYATSCFATWIAQTPSGMARGCCFPHDDNGNSQWYWAPCDP